MSYIKNNSKSSSATYIIIWLFIVIFVAVSAKIIQVNINTKYLLSFLEGTTKTSIVSRQPVEHTFKEQKLQSRRLN
jgi:hypothetical protein